MGPGFSSVDKVFVFPMLQFVRNVKRKFSGQQIYLFTSHFCFWDIPGPADMSGDKNKFYPQLTGGSVGPGPSRIFGNLSSLDSSLGLFLSSMAGHTLSSHIYFVNIYYMVCLCNTFLQMLVFLR